MEKPVEQGGSEHFSITLPSFVMADLNRIAAKRGHSRSSVIREMVLIGVERAARLEKLAAAVS